MIVRGVGRTPNDYMLVGPYPGFHEDRSGVPFTGKVGEELDRFLNGADLPERDDWYLTNLYKFYGGKDYVYTASDLEIATDELTREVRRVQPKLLVTMGREVTRLFLGDVDITDVESIPWIDPNDHDRVIFPLVHIAAGMRNPELSPYVVNGFAELGNYLAGRIEPRLMYDDPYPEPHYEEITDTARLGRVLDQRPTGASIHIDTEGWPGLPWSLQFSFAPGEGYLIRATTAPVLAAFSRYLQTRRPRLTFHSALHDLSMCRVFGVDVTGLTFDDTMVMAYLLQLVPQGLKAGCLRYCNMRMSDYMDIMGDTANDLAREYLTWLWDREMLEHDLRCEAEFVRFCTTPYTNAKGKVVPGRKLKKWPSLPKSGLLKAVTRVIQSKRPHELWQDQVEDLQVAAYKALGPLPPATLDYVDPVVAVNYGSRDADGTGRLLPEYRQRIAAMGLESVYELELSTYPLIERMHTIGMKPDLDHFKSLSTVLQYDIEQLDAELKAATGLSTFNANSGDQVADYVFGTLNLEEMKMTRSGRGSTNDKVLEALEKEHPEFPVLSDIRSYRELYKLKNTFVDRLPDFVNRWPHDGRIHPTFRTTRVVTGRLAASEPNILAMPKHGKFAKDFRRGWVPDDGHVMGSWDLSQIELRIAAHLSRDPVMMAIYRGERRNPDESLIDLHAALAERIFGVKPSDQDESKHRLPSKAINFGFWMGQTCTGLQTELRKNGMAVDEDDAQRWLDDAHSLYRGARPYMEERAAEARRTGCVRCLSGRVRYIGGIRSTDERTRAEAERFAFSTPIQEGAQTVMKTNEAVLWSEIIVPLQRQGYWIEPLVQIHDDLVLEMQEDIATGVSAMMVECMTQSYKGLLVPIKTSASIGRNWADMKELK